MSGPGYMTGLNKVSAQTTAVVLFVCAAALATPMTLNNISANSARLELQSMADKLALTALLSTEPNDEAALELALAGSGLDRQRLSPTLRRYSTGNGRASEVVLANRHIPPLTFLDRDGSVLVEVTGRAITWQ